MRRTLMRTGLDREFGYENIDDFEATQKAGRANADSHKETFYNFCHGRLRLIESSETIAMQALSKS
jgi:hypothetical protein